jgi:pilus assembly protein Flp/PilA
MLRGFVADESGQDLIEYALLGSFLAIASIATLKLIGSQVAKSFTPISAALS